MAQLEVSDNCFTNKMSFRIKLRMKQILTPLRQKKFCQANRNTDMVYTDSRLQSKTDQLTLQNPAPSTQPINWLITMGPIIYNGRILPTIAVAMVSTGFRWKPPTL